MHFVVECNEIEIYLVDLWQVRILVSLFPSWLLGLYKKLIAPLGEGKVAAVMVGAYAFSLDAMMLFHLESVRLLWLYAVELCIIRL